MFCKSCGSLLVPEADEKGKMKFSCRKCGQSSRNKDLKIIDSNTKKSKLFFVDDKEKEEETIRVKCPKCGKMKASFWIIQTRGADEPPTKFFKCVACEHTWRDYD
ncbi:MAG: transcription factor S [Candidatus Nanoarchaeia archaeon]|jgi:DNA-directed RNA polymerase subunit M